MRAIEQVIIDALAEFGIAARADPGLHRRVGGWQEGRRNRRTHQPLGHVARLRVESYDRFELLPVHRAVRADEAGHFDAGAGIWTPSRDEVLAALSTRFARQFQTRELATLRERAFIYGDIFMIDVVMPQMGESIVEGTLTKWLKKPGEHVERDEPLFEISTDKVDTEIPSPAAGVLAEVLVEEGKTVAINTVVGRIDEGAGNGASAPAPVAAKAAPAPPAPNPEAAPPAAEAPRRRNPRLCPSPWRTPPARIRFRWKSPRRRWKLNRPPVRFRRWCARWRASTTSI